MSQITMKNISNGIIVVVLPDGSFRRELSPGRVVTLTRAQYDDLMYDPGFTTLVQGHYIEIDGIADEKRVEVSDSPYFDTVAIAKMLDANDVSAFSKFITNAKQGEKEAAVQLAIEKGITNPGITALIKQKCGVDIINAISMRHMAEE